MSEAATAEVGARIAFKCRERWRTAKDMARDLNIAVSTAEKIRVGQRPQNRLIDQMAALPGWGWGFLHFIYEPIAGAAPLEARLNAELGDLKDRIGSLQASLRQNLKGSE